MKQLYNSKEYIKNFKLESGKIQKRGSNGKNWKVNGDFICESLHYANNIYQALGKQIWIMKGKSNTWKIQDSPNRCIVITKNKTQCIKSRSINCNMCTQHKLLLS